jgi:hypothetical protein
MLKKIKKFFSIQEKIYPKIGDVWIQRPRDRGPWSDEKDRKVKVEAIQDGWVLYKIIGNKYYITDSCPLDSFMFSYVPTELK